MITFNGNTFASWQEARESLLPVSTPPADDNTPSEPTITPPDAPPAPTPAVRKALVETYRPRTLADVVGQPKAVAQLSALAADPYPCAVLLCGATGTGKTSAAWALAGDLGCDLDATPPEFGGIHSIASGEHTAEALRVTWPTLWTMPLHGSGWKVLIVNEVEQLTGTVERIWLDKLEDLPPRTVIVFTTNNVESLPERFCDRCAVIEFDADAGRLAEAAASLASGIWTAETGELIPANLLSRVVSQASRGGRLSFRRVVQALVPLLAAKGL